jgi:hypothetical protein
VTGDLRTGVTVEPSNFGSGIWDYRTADRQR